MKPTEIARLHQRIDELVEKMNELSGTVMQSLAACEACRPFVMGGNGRPPLSDCFNAVQQEMNDIYQGLTEKIADIANEVTALKTARDIGSRFFWTAIGIAGTISGAIVGVLLKWWLGTS